MRTVTRMVLLGLAFTIPWEYSLDLGPPYGNIARIVGVGLVLAAVLSTVRSGTVRKPGSLQWLSLALFLWMCCSVLWTLDRTESLHHVRTYAQEVMILWAVWEFVDTPLDLRRLMQAYVAGAAVLSLLTLGSFALNGTPGQVRFVAEGHDPNDAARILVFALPLAALLLDCGHGRLARALFAAYLPLGSLAILLTASRSGFLAAMVALVGSCWLLLLRKGPRGAVAALFGIPALASAVWLVAPSQTLLRIASVMEELQYGDLNRRWDIWKAGWQAFLRSPFFGSGAGSFVSAAKLAPGDTAHNTVMALAVEGGIAALLIGGALVASTASSVTGGRGPLRIALASVVAVGLLSSLIATIQEDRATWLLIGMVSVAARLSADDAQGTAVAFSTWDLPAGSFGPAAATVQE